MAKYAPLPNINSSVFDGVEFHSRKTPVGLITRDGLRVGPGDQPATGNLEVTSGDTYTDFKLVATSMGDTTSWVIRSNRVDNALQIIDTVAATTPVTIQDGSPNNLMFMSSLGRVGINTNLPEQALTVAGNAHVKVSDSGAAVNQAFTVEGLNPNINICSSSVATGALLFSDSAFQGAGKITYNHFFDRMSFAAFNADRMWLTGLGRLGLGTNSPVGNFEIKTTATETNMVITADDGVSDNTSWKLESSRSADQFVIANLVSGSPVVRLLDTSISDSIVTNNLGVGFGKVPSFPVDIKLPTADLAFLDAGSNPPSPSSYIQVRVNGLVRYIRLNLTP